MRFWRRYVPVAERRVKAQRQMKKLQKQGQIIQPVEIAGRTIARTFWGKGWCDHLESFSDYANRLPRGRSYVRNGSVCHLEILPGRIEAVVSGSELYQVSIAIQPLKAKLWKAIRQKCAGQIGSLLELLRGRLSQQVMGVVTHRATGLFPQPGEIRLQCSCPDWAVMCKHVAAVLYGVGNRLDDQPELLFSLRGVDAGELIATPIALPTETVGAAADALADDVLADIFGIDLETEAPVEAKPIRTEKKRPKKARSKTRKSTGTPEAARKPPSSTPSKRITVQRAATPSALKTPTGKSLARLRKQMGHTVAQFAAVLGVTAASVYRWEKTPGKLNLHQRPLNALRAMQAKTAAE